MTKIKGKVNNIEQDLNGAGCVRITVNVRLYPKGWAVISFPEMLGFKLGDEVELTIKKVG
jgi:hypothetical protein